MLAPCLVDVAASGGRIRPRVHGRRLLDNDGRFTQTCLCERTRLLEDRVGDRTDVRVDAPEIRDQVEVKRRSLDAVQRVSGETVEMRIGVGPLQLAERYFLRKQLLCAFLV